MGCADSDRITGHWLPTETKEVCVKWEVEPVLQFWEVKLKRGDSEDGLYLYYYAPMS